MILFPSATFCHFLFPICTICLPTELLSLLFHVLYVTDFILQLHWPDCFLLYLPVITFSTLYSPCLLLCPHSYSSVISNTPCLWEGNKFIIQVLVVKNISTVLEQNEDLLFFFFDDLSQMSRCTHMVCVCCWCWSSADQVQVHNLPLGGDKKPKDSSKVVYTLLHQPRHWPGGKNQV